MKRREFIIALAAAISPSSSFSQTAERARRVGILVSFNEADPDAQSYVKAMKQKLQDLNWKEGRNITFEVRWDAAESKRAQALAKELVDLQCDLIIACAAPSAVAAWKTTQSIPVVFAQVTDPVALGLVKTFAMPGGNLTGFTHFESAICGKWLGLLHEVTPNLTTAAILFDSNNPSSPVYLKGLAKFSTDFGIQLSQQGVINAEEIKRSIEQVADEPNSGIVVLPNPLTQKHRELIVTLAAEHRVPVIYPHALYVRSGGLMAYGIDLVEMYRETATYADRILRGEKPNNLPVQAPTRYELALNLKAAKSLGINLTPTLLAQANEVVE